VLTWNEPVIFIVFELGDKRMANIDLNDILGLIDSNKGEIICRDCLKEEELSYIPEEEVITKDKIQGDEKYQCSRCNKEL
jgi:hypothetical protein